MENKLPILLITLISIFSGGCSKEQSSIMKELSPSALVAGAGKTHGVVFSPDSGGEGWGGGYAHRTWNYFSRDKNLTDDALKTITDEVTRGIQKAIGDLGGRVEPILAWGAYFQIRSFDYVHRGRKGSLRVTAGLLDRGTAVTVIMEERPY